MLEFRLVYHGFSSFSFCQSFFLLLFLLFFFCFYFYISSKNSFISWENITKRTDLNFSIFLYWNLLKNLRFIHLLSDHSILFPLCIQVLRQSKTLIFTITGIVSGSYNSWLTKIFEYLQKLSTNMSNVC